MLQKKTNAIGFQFGLMGASVDAFCKGAKELFYEMCRSNLSERGCIMKNFGRSTELTHPFNEEECIVIAMIETGKGAISPIAFLCFPANGKKIPCRSVAGRTYQEKVNHIFVSLDSASDDAFEC